MFDLLFRVLGYQVFLSSGLNKYLLSEKRGTDLMNQNKEGIFSIFGEDLPVLKWMKCSFLLSFSPFFFSLLFPFFPLLLESGRWGRAGQLENSTFFSWCTSLHFHDAQDCLRIIWFARMHYSLSLSPLFSFLNTNLSLHSHLRYAWYM